MLNAFRTSNQIPAAKAIFLLFDGERLDPDSSIENTEISDMDYVEVYIK